MKLNLDNKYHHQLPGAGEARRQHVTQPTAGAPSERGSPSPSGSSTYNRGLPDWCEISQADWPFNKKPGECGSTRHSPGTKDIPPGSPQGRALNDHSGHPQRPPWEPQRRGHFRAGSGEGLPRSRPSSCHALVQAANPPLPPPQAPDDLGGDGSQGTGKAAQQETGPTSRPREWELMLG